METQPKFSKESKAFRPPPPLLREGRREDLHQRIASINKARIAARVMEPGPVGPDGRILEMNSAALESAGLTLPAGRPCSPLCKNAQGIRKGIFRSKVMQQDSVSKEQSPMERDGKKEGGLRFPTLNAFGIASRRFTSIFRMAFPQHMKKYTRVLKKHQNMMDCRSVYLAKFVVKASDPISIAMLAASDDVAVVRVFVCRMMPLVVMALVAIILASLEEYPGIEFLEKKASALEISIGFLALGVFVLVNLFGPLTRPFGVCKQLFNMRQILRYDSEFAGDASYSLFKAGVSLLLLHFAQAVVVLLSTAIAVLQATAIIPMLWTALALAWLLFLDEVLLKEVVHRYYRNSTITVAVSELEWADMDTKKEFWSRSWASKSDIRRGLLDLDVPSAVKWQLLCDPNKGLGLGSTDEGLPTLMNLEVVLFKWSEMDESKIADMGSVAARAVQAHEWVYHISRQQRKIFFRYYPLVAAELPWRERLTVDHIPFTVEHTAAAARIIEHPKNEIHTVFLQSNSISDEGASLIAQAVKVNTNITKLWMYDNEISDIGGVSIAKALRDHPTLTTLHLRGNSIGDAGAFEFADTIVWNKVMRVLGLDNNRIGDLGIQRLLSAAKGSQSMRKLWLLGNDFNEENLALQADASDLGERVVLSSSSLLPPVVQHLVRSKLEELKLNRKERKLALKKLKHWSQAIRKQTEGKNPVQAPALLAEASQMDADIGEQEVRDIVKDILKQLPESEKLIKRHQRYESNTKSLLKQSHQKSLPKLQVLVPQKEAQNTPQK